MSNVTLLSLIDAQLSYGNLPLLDRASMSMSDGERVGLIGRNGTGKSSLLAVIAGRTALDDGELRLRDGVRVAAVEVGSSRVDLQACKLEYSIVSPK